MAETPTSRIGRSIAAFLGLLACTGALRAGEPDLALRPRPPFPEEGMLRLSGLAWTGRGFVGLGPGHTLVRLDPDGRFIGSTPAPGLPESGCVAFDPERERTFLVDRTRRATLAIDASGATAPFAPLPDEGFRPAALAWDAFLGRLLLLDPPGRRVVGLAPGEPALVLPLPGAIGDPVGLAVRPRGHLLVADRAAGRLVELSPRGDIVQAFDLAEVDPSQGFAVGPTRDGTDDPARSSLFLLEGREPARILELALEPAVSENQGSASGNVPGSLVNAFETSQWSPPSPDPTGLAFRTSTGSLLVSDSEVDEMNIFRSANVWESTPAGSAVDTCDVTGFTFEPTGTAWDEVTGRWFLSDDDMRRVFEIDPGPDDRPGTPDDTITSIRTNDFGSTDPEGIAFDESGRRLFIADGVNGEVYVVLPGPDGLFNGVPPLADDLVSSFDTDALGLTDTEGIEYNPDSGVLFLVSRTGSVVAETTTDGTLLRTIDISSLGLNNPSGLAYGPGSNNPGVKHLYIADRGVDNDDDPKENDGRIVEATLVEEPGTLESRVTASSDDAEEKESGSIALRSPDLELAFDGEDQTVGLRFLGIELPRGADLAEAWIQFRANEAGSNQASLEIRAEASDDAPTFRSVSGNLSSRPMTVASADWEPPAWLRAGDQGMAQRTGDLSAVLEEVLARPGWNPGNAVVLLVTGSGTRAAKAWDLAPASAPLLHVRLAPTCGNGVKGPGEDCDGADLDGVTCAVQGCGGGAPTCTSTCTLDFSTCTVQPEACNGLDDDCDGTVDNPPPPAGRPLLDVASDPGGTVLTWTAEAGATGYDIVRGSIDVLRATGDFTGSTEACLGDDQAATSATDPEVPAADSGRWYLVRPINCGGAGTYADPEPGLAAPRDPGIALSPAACP